MFTEAEMNIFYNAADVLAYPTRGEGFGLPSFEAMGVKTPVIATNFGPQREIHRQGRGYFIDIRDVIPADFAGWSYFALPDHRSLYKQLKFVHDNPEHVAETVERAYEFVKDFSWSNQAKRLDEILDKLPEKESNDVLVQTA
jgi:glycosyltransferase involved in cell wall biosynthesis